MVTMYQEHFGFNAPPFSIAPDPHYLYMSERHREALAHLLYGIKSAGGFVLLTGEVGTGKTTICRCLLEQVPDHTDIAFILNPKLTVQELLALICEEFGINYPEGNTSIKVFVDHINAFLLDSHAKGRQAVLIIDEAQNLSVDVLEQLRLLTNLETNERKLLQIIMLGQPELKDILSQKELRQLAQRITARYHLEPLSEKEVGAYVAHRLAIAGGASKIFPALTIKKLFHLSSGTPRLINIICDRALLGTYVQGLDQVDKSTLIKAAREVLGEIPHRLNRLGKTARWAIAGLFLLLSGTVLAVAYYNQAPQAEAPIAPIVIEQQKLVDENANQEKPDIAPLAWPAEKSAAESETMAYQALFNSWKIKYIPNENISVCQFAESQGLRCLHLQGSLDSLLHLNRPAVLTLYDDNGKSFFATLTKFHGQTATFVIGTDIKTVTVEDIWLRWLGEYSLLWTRPAEYIRAVEPGDLQTNVGWLDKKMALIQKRPANPSDIVTFNDALINEVKQFQFAKNLVPDGIVGPQTIIHVNSAIGNNIPKLIDMQGDN